MIGPLVSYKDVRYLICVAQSVTDVCLTADPGVAGWIPTRSHTFVEIDHEIISMVILLPSADLWLLSATSESMCPKY